jgi:exodeoxyribonuclease V alpha subunit
MDTLSGVVERITYYNAENGYTVLRLRPDEKMANRFTNKSSLNAEGLITVVGSLPELSPGEHLRLQGQWDNHPKHGPQFKSEICEQTLPATVAGIQGYLGSGMIKGIGPRFAERIVELFKEDTFNIIEATPNRLLEVSGIGLDRMNKITNAWKEQKQVKEIMIFLHGQVSTNLASRYIKRMGMLHSKPSRKIHINSKETTMLLDSKPQTASLKRLVCPQNILHASRQGLFSH